MQYFERIVMLVKGDKLDQKAAIRMYLDLPPINRRQFIKSVFNGMWNHGMNDTQKCTLLSSRV